MLQQHTATGTSLHNTAAINPVTRTLPPPPHQGREVENRSLFSCHLISHKISHNSIHNTAIQCDRTCCSVAESTLTSKKEKKRQRLPSRIGSRHRRALAHWATWVFMAVLAEEDTLGSFAGHLAGSHRESDAVGRFSQ